MEQASVMMTGFNIDRILQGINQLEKQEVGINRNLMNVDDYSTPNVSEKVVRIILSYTDYINRNVWKS